MPNKNETTIRFIRLGVNGTIEIWEGKNNAAIPLFTGNYISGIKYPVAGVIVNEDCDEEIANLKDALCNIERPPELDFIKCMKIQELNLVLEKQIDCGDADRDKPMLEFSEYGEIQEPDSFMEIKTNESFFWEVVRLVITFGKRVLEWIMWSMNDPLIKNCGIGGSDDPGGHKFVGEKESSDLNSVDGRSIEIGSQFIARPVHFKISVPAKQKEGNYIGRIITFGFGDGSEFKSKPCFDGPLSGFRKCEDGECVLDYRTTLKLDTNVDKRMYYLVEYLWYIENEKGQKELASETDVADDKSKAFRFVIGNVDVKDLPSYFQTNLGFGAPIPWRQKRSTTK